MTPPPESNRPATDLTVQAPLRRTPMTPSMAMARGSDAGAAVQGITPAFVLKVLRGRWPLVVPLGLLLSGGAAAAVFALYVPKYRAAALIRIESQPAFIAFAQQPGGASDDRYVQTQIELLRGPVILTPALGKKNLANLEEIKDEVDPIDFLKRKLQVAQIGKSELYEVAFESRSPQDAATLVNEVVMTYLDAKRNEETKRSQAVIGVLEKESDERRLRVDRLRQEVVDLARKLTGKDPFQPGLVTDVASLSSLSAAGSLQQGIIDAEVAAEVAKAELQALKTSAAAPDDHGVDSGILALEIANRADVRRAEEEVESLHDGMTAIKNKSRTKIGDSWNTDPEYLSLEEAAKEAKAKLFS